MLDDPTASSRIFTLTPRRDRRRKRLRERQADVAGPVDVGLDGDRAFGALNRVEHRGVELVAVVQHDQLVAFGRTARRWRRPWCPGIPVSPPPGRDRGRTEAGTPPASRASRRPAQSPMPNAAHQLSLIDVVDAENRPRPPRPDQPADVRPRRGDALRTGQARVGRAPIARAAPVRPLVPQPWVAPGIRRAATHVRGELRSWRMIWTAR